MFGVQSFRRERGITLFGPDPHCGGNSTSRRHDVLTYPIIRDGLFTYLLTYLLTYFLNVGVKIGAAMTSTEYCVRNINEIGKGKSLITCYSATYMRQSRIRKGFTISQVAADWHELMIPQCIMRPSIACYSEHLIKRCSMQTHHRPNQPYQARTSAATNFISH